MYKIIFRSNKPWAEEFQDFACDAIKEITLTTQSLNPLESIFAKQFMEHNVEIFGTKDEPLFKAKQIGDMLGLSNIREIIKNFSSKQKVVSLD